MVDKPSQNSQSPRRAGIRLHVLIFLAPAVLVYTAVMILPLFGTLQLSLFQDIDNSRVFVGLENFRRLLGDPRPVSYTHLTLPTNREV